MTMSKCHIWEGTIRKADGRAVTDSKEYAYRVLWEAVNGPLPEGYVLHHTCNNPSCVRLSHLQAMTQSDHMKIHSRGGDWGQADKTHCPQGHPYDDENTYTHKRSDGRIERHCKTCRIETKRRYRARKAGRF
jgi:hypothetical protein